MRWLSSGFGLPLDGKHITPEEEPLPQWNGFDLTINCEGLVASAIF
jgi:hypothetical protein